MPRGKLEMKLIENPKKRRATYKTRRDGLVNKTSQLATLCGVDALLVCFDDHKNAGGGGAAAVTTWPADCEEALKLISKYRETPVDKIRHTFTAARYYQEELAKQQRKLVKIEQGGSDMLGLQDCRLADLSPADLGALLATMDEALLKVQQRIVALGGHVVDDDDGDHVPAAATAMVTAPIATQADYNSFDLAFSKPDAGSMVTPQYNYPAPHEIMLPQPVPLQPPSLSYHQMPLLGYTFQMPAPNYTLQMPPPLPPSYTFQMPQPRLIAPLDQLGINGTDTMDFTPFAMNFANGAATVPGFYDNSMPAGIDAVGGGVYVDAHVVAGGQDVATRHASAGYQHEHHMSAGVWTMGKTNNNVSRSDGCCGVPREG